jgi:hypothetical protein
MPSAISIFVFPWLPYIQPLRLRRPPFSKGELPPCWRSAQIFGITDHVFSALLRSRFLDVIPAHAGIQPRRSRPAIQGFLDSRPGLLAARADVLSWE